MDEQTQRYAEEMMRRFEANESGAVSIPIKVKRLQRRLMLMAHAFLHQDALEEPAKNSGIWTKVAFFFRQSVRRMTIWMIQRLVLIAKRFSS